MIFDLCLGIKNDTNYYFAIQIGIKRYFPNKKAPLRSSDGHEMTQQSRC